MRRISCLLVVLLALLTGKPTLAQQGDIQKKMAEQIRPYWFVMLTRGANRTQDSAKAVEIQRGHLANINRLYEEGKIKAAGPFGDKGNWIGLFIFDCPTKEEVEQLLQSDPAVSSGRLAYEIHLWYTAPIGSFAPGKPKKD
jgi:uncharacterized protein